MGTGKTSAAINFINHAPKERRFLFVTPYLDEVHRIIEACPEKNFQEPKEMGSKKKGIIHLMKKGANIASTHSLFQTFTEDMIAYIQAYNYTLILDEVTDVVETVNLSQRDRETLLDKYVQMDEHGFLHWIDPEYSGRFEDIQHQCDMGCLAMYGDTVLLWLFPVKVFAAFESVYLLTYLFDGQPQRGYFDMYEVSYRRLYVVKCQSGAYQFSETPPLYELTHYQELIHICDDQKMNAIGSLVEGALSSTWYRKASDDVLRQLRNNIGNFCRNIMRCKSGQVLWTTYSSAKQSLSGKGYAKGFLACNARATNQYKDRTVLCYLVNWYMKPPIKKFFEQEGIRVDEDLYALSAMLQWIWRSAIRENREIWLYLPSVRMRRLLETWLDEQTAAAKKAA